jgi:hypothetical protein
MKPLLILMCLAPILLLPAMASATHDAATGGGCCKDGSSPFASQSKDAWRPNANAGYQGSDLPPSVYNPDHLDRYDASPSRHNPYDRGSQTQPSNDPLRFDPSWGLCGGGERPVWWEVTV